MNNELRIPTVLKNQTKFCPGCGHGIVNRLIAEVLEELKIENRSVCSLAVGCSCLMAVSFGIDMIQAQHGRAPAVATGFKRVNPDVVVFCYQGDGDICSIGLAEIIHAAIRNENITSIFVNNGVFGMTGGQMAPTSLPGQKTLSSQNGRDVNLTGVPLKLPEMLSMLPVAYIARGSVSSIMDIKNTKHFIRNAFLSQLNNEGFSMVEILSPCPTNWHLSPIDSLIRINNEVKMYYSVGERVARKGQRE